MYLNLDSFREPAYYEVSDGTPIKFYIYADNKRVQDKAPSRQMLTFKVHSSEDLFVGLFSNDSSGSPFLNADILEIKAGETKPFTIDGKERGILMPPALTKFGVFLGETKEAITEEAKLESWENFEVIHEISPK